MNYDNIIISISTAENISINEFKKIIKSFEKLMKNEISKYKFKYGFEDFKMNYFDYDILYYLYINSYPFKNKIKLLLYYIYSFYKLDGINFTENFPLNDFFNFIKTNDNLHKIIISYLNNIS